MCARMMPVCCDIFIDVHCLKFTKLFMFRVVNHWLIDTWWAEPLAIGGRGLGVEDII